MHAREERRENYGWGLAIASRWADCDAYGHVNNAIYYSWFDTALTTLAIERGVLRGPAASIGLCIASGCEFLASIEFPETVEARVRIGRIGDKSLRYEIALFRDGEAVPAAVGHFTHVFVAPDTRRPVALTPEQKQAMADLVPATPATARTTGPAHDG